MGYTENRVVLVLMSTYNGESFLEDQLNSILSQELSDVNCQLKIWIRDDGSQDNTLKIVGKYLALYENISFMKDSLHLGPAKSFLYLLKNTPDAEYYAFADQDDIWDRDKLASGIKALEGRKSPALYCANARLTNIEGRDIDKLALKRKETFTDIRSVICTGQFIGCTMIFNRCLAKKIRSVPSPDVVIMHDHYLSCVCALLDGVIIYDSIPHMSYRQHGDNAVGIKTGIMAKVRSHADYILKKKDICLYQQAGEWLRLYGSSMVQSNINFLHLLISTEHSFIARVRIAFFEDIHYTSINMSITNRLAFLIGNK